MLHHHFWAISVSFVRLNEFSIRISSQSNFRIKMQFSLLFSSIPAHLVHDRIIPMKYCVLICYLIPLMGSSFVFECVLEIGILVIYDKPLDNKSTNEKQAKHPSAIVWIIFIHRISILIDRVSQRFRIFRFRICELFPQSILDFITSKIGFKLHSHTTAFLNWN